MVPPHWPEVRAARWEGECGSVPRADVQTHMASVQCRVGHINVYEHKLALIQTVVAHTPRVPGAATYRSDFKTNKINCRFSQVKSKNGGVQTKWFQLV